jgi:hypothetical protein
MVREGQGSVIGPSSDTQSRALARCRPRRETVSEEQRSLGDQILSDCLAGGLRSVANAKLVLRLLEMRPHGLFT